MSDKTLQDVTTGDFLIAVRQSSHGHDSIAEVVGTTATQIVTARNRYRKKDGYRIGDYGGWSRPRVRLPKDGELDQIRAREAAEELEELVRRAKPEEIVEAFGLTLIHDLTRKLKTLKKVNNA